MSRAVQTEELLNLRISTHETGEVSLAEYLANLLEVVWNSGELFSARYGAISSTDWQWCVYAAMISEGFITGEIDEDGVVQDPDTDEADRLICIAIRECFGVPLRVVEKTNQTVLNWR